MNGIEKASLGTRYLLKYIDNRNTVYFDVIKDCISDMKFWALLMHFCNNMDELFELIPEDIIKRVFECAEIAKMTDVLSDTKSVSFEYGKGFHSTMKDNYRTQLRLIRNCLAHGYFEFDGKTINVFHSDTKFKATFDIKWFDTLVMCLLSNANYVFKKGIVDYTMVNIDGREKDFKTLYENGDIKLIKLTCVTDDTKVIESKFAKLSKYKGQINFDKMKTVFLRLLNAKTKERAVMVGKHETFLETLKLLQKVFKGIFKIEIEKIDDKYLSDPEFLKFDFKEACDYLTNKYNQEDKVKRNTIELKSILEILDKIAGGESLTQEEEYSLQDWQFFLLKLYGYILFASGDRNEKYMRKVFDEFLRDMHFDYVYAHRVWMEYIKKISKSIDVLKEAKASAHQIELWKERLGLYQSRMKGYMDTREYYNPFRKLRNALTHGLVEERNGDIVFYGEEPAIKVPRLKKKTGEIVEVSFQNNGRTFELTINKEVYLQMLDRLYGDSGIDISVNIAKYRQRKGYLSSLLTCNRKNNLL